MKTYTEEKECQIKEIKENWFKEHIATITELRGITILDWKQHDSVIFSIRYVFDGYNMYITGDLGEAIFRFTEKAVPERIASYNLSYFHEKLRAFCDSKYDFDRTKAKETLDYILNGREDIDNSIYKELRRIIEDSDSVDSYRINLANLDIYKLDNDAWEWVGTLGNVIPIRVQAYLIGLQMATECLRKEYSINE
jgi:hypothetical protein